MKKKGLLFKVLLLVFAVLLSGFMASCTSSASKSTGGILDNAKVDRTYENMSEKAGKPEYKILQGGCTDGTYAYYVLENNSVPGSICELVKIRLSDWQIVKMATNIDINHGNDLTYNSKTNQIVAVHNKPKYTTISFIDPNTLEVLSSSQIKDNIYSIGYNAKTDQYVIGVSDGYNFKVLNSDFSIAASYTGQVTNYTRQGGDCDENYIYFIQSGKSDNIIVVYDWNGKYIKSVKVPISSEGENIFHIGSVFYTGYNTSKGAVYKTQLN
ncbi:MAG: hypothetical protein Q8865_10600 [Bacillota bacterium]|nr:hypothetical protein [Bacillota bacterium]